MEHYMDLRKVEEKRIVPLSEKFYGKDRVSGRELSFTNYYMQIDGKPFMGISGECHYSRVHENQWEDTILKMKMGGINIVSSYVFWIHHEEAEGVFRFDGNRNVRKFLQLCRKHGMYAIMRIGPFDHGEVRNGGLPDWLYGKPFEARSVNEGFLECTRKLYRRLSEQFEGLYFQDGGPIIGVQIENEYMHSAAPWELTTGITNEWVPGGSDGDSYMLALKRIAREEGIVAPIYTCTGWGGAAAPVEELLPLWGGYAFWPWIYYDYRGEHPATPEYIYRDNHNNGVPETYNFKPGYEPERLPYACCEMGGGMSCYYHYRFQFPYESVDAMANIKLAGGCNFLGYYMYRGGSNPRGEHTPFLNEFQCPKISYDYQAAIGEYGQLRPSYHRLRALHLFMKNFGDQLCAMRTVLPRDSQDIRPEDVDTLRYALRTDGKRGFLFLNNYQDHVTCKDKAEETVELQLKEKTVSFTGLSLGAGEEAVLPFELDVEGYGLILAKAQPLSVIRDGSRVTYFFFVPKGMEGEYLWSGEHLAKAAGRTVESDTVSVKVPSDRMSAYVLEGEKGRVEIVTLTREQSMNFYELDVKGERTALLCDSPVTWDGETLRVESPREGACETRLLFYPEWRVEQIGNLIGTEPFGEGIWAGIKINWEPELLRERRIEAKTVGKGRYCVTLPEVPEEWKDGLLRIGYTGDIGHLFVDGRLISDNFYNGAIWEVGMKETAEEGELTVLITPVKSGVTVDVSSTMAGRTEQTEHSEAELRSVSFQPVWETAFVMDKILDKAVHQGIEYRRYIV